MLEKYSAIYANIRSLDSVNRRRALSMKGTSQFLIKLSEHMRFAISY